MACTHWQADPTDEPPGAISSDGLCVVCADRPLRSPDLNDLLGLWVLRSAALVATLVGCCWVLGSVVRWVVLGVACV